jgi:hypothetical protein
MITSNQCMELILLSFPGFRERWNEWVAWWDGEESGLSNDMAEFSRYVADLIIQGQNEDLPQIFDYIETLMVEGDNEVKNAAATCFLENLINRSDRSFSPLSFTPLLGPESRDYCKGWDEFTGVKTKGL